jgi:hypothetical protein
LCVEHSVGATVPEFLKSGQEAGESVDFVRPVFVLDHDLFPVSGSVVTVQVDVRRTRIGRVVVSRGKNSGDILPTDPTGA